MKRPLVWYHAAFVGALAVALGALFGRTWVLIGLVVGYLVVSVLIWYDERKLLEELQQLPEPDQDDVLAHDLELAAELRRKLDRTHRAKVPPNKR